MVSDTQTGNEGSEKENLSVKIVDREEDENSEDNLIEKARTYSDKIKAASEEDKLRSDNKQPAGRKLDGDKGGSLPDPEALSLRGD